MSDEIIIPYNINNVLITNEDIKKLFQKYNLDIDVKNINHYISALTHKSYVLSEYTRYNHKILKTIKDGMDKDIVDLRQESYERIEFLGDSVIKLLVAKYLYIRYRTESEGFLTKTKTKIENKKTLAHFARKLGIDEFMIISKQNEEAINRDSDKFLEDIFEGFMGALFLDQGLDFCEKYLTILLETEIDYSDILYRDTNFKDRLQRFFHENGWKHPVFEDISTDYVNNKKMFTVCVKDNDNKIIADAQDTTKKKAEQKASMLALISYRLLYADQIVEEFDQ